jgi:hypothetical protein
MDRSYEPSRLNHDYEHRQVPVLRKYYIRPAADTRASVRLVRPVDLADAEACWCDGTPSPYWQFHDPPSAVRCGHVVRLALMRRARLAAENLFAEAAGPLPEARSQERAKLAQVDLHWHDVRHEGASRLLADGGDIRIIQLMLGHSDIKTTQRYLNITDEELRTALTGVLERHRQLLAIKQVSKVG